MLVAEDDMITRITNMSILVTNMNTPVGFHARLSTYNIPTNTPIKYTDVKINKGGRYSTATGKFTASIHGLYYFELYWVMQYNEGQNLYMWKNGIEQCRSVGTHNTGGGDTYASTSPSCSAVMELVPGDQVWVTSIYGRRVYCAECTGFTGFLIQAYV